MATNNAITSDGRAAIEKVVTLQTEIDVGDDWETVFEISRCIQWISDNKFKKIALQFPDEYLKYSPRILRKLEETTQQQCFVLADSTYGSCCVDEKTALHIPNVDSLIHFGQSCLSCSVRLPVLFVFTKPIVNMDRLMKLFEESFKPSDKILLLFDVIYAYASDLLQQRLGGWNNLVKSKLIVPNLKKDEECESFAEQERTFGIVKHNRWMPIPPEEIDNFQCFYIGSKSLPNLLLAFPNNSFKIFDPQLNPESLSTRTASLDKLLRKRNFYIEKVRDAKSVGILVGTLVVEKYLEVIDRLKKIFRTVGKRFFIVSVGEINPCKLANFMDIDCFVFVGCSEVVNFYISDESKGEFFQPILTPFDVEMAFCEVDDSANYSSPERIADWTFLVDQGFESSF